MAHSTTEAEPFAADHSPIKGDLVKGLTPAEKAFLAALRLFLDNGLTSACDAGAKQFLQVAPTYKAARRRAYALLRLAAEHVINDAEFGRPYDLNLGDSP
jgi:hypothetical protein